MAFKSVQIKKHYEQKPYIHKHTPYSVQRVRKNNAAITIKKCRKYLEMTVSHNTMVTEKKTFLNGFSQSLENPIYLVITVSLLFLHAQIKS